MARTTPRPRRSISPRWARFLTLVGFRYSTTRDAYVLRLVGNRFGPVFQISTRVRPESHLRAEASSEPVER